MSYPEQDEQVVRWHNLGCYFIIPSVLLAICLVALFAVKDNGKPHTGDLLDCNRRHCYEDDRKFYVEQYCTLAQSLCHGCVPANKTVIFFCGRGPSCESVMCNIPVYEDNKVYLSGYIRTYERIVTKTEYVRAVSILVMTIVIAVCMFVTLAVGVGFCAYSHVLESGQYTYVRSDGHILYGGL